MKYIASDQIYEIDDFLYEPPQDQLNDMFQNEFKPHLSPTITQLDNQSMTETNENSQPASEQISKDSEITHSKSITKKAKPHLLNDRRKKSQRNVLKLLVQKAVQSTKNSMSQKQIQNLTQNIGQLTKNLLAFAKYAHFTFFQSRLGKDFFSLKQNAWLLKIKQGNGISVDDYEKIYRCQYLQDVLTEFFEKKIIYRELMISRTIAVNKMLYLYFLDIFEVNFKNKEFKGISETKIKLEKKKNSAIEIEKQE